jgi:hypothetical protein
MDARAWPHVIVDVAKGVSKGLYLRTVQGVSFATSIPRRFRSALLKELRLQMVQRFRFLVNQFRCRATFARVEDTITGPTKGYL